MDLFSNCLGIFIVLMWLTQDLNSAFVFVFASVFVFITPLMFILDFEILSL